MIWSCAVIYFELMRLKALENGEDASKTRRVSTDRRDFTYRK